MNGIYRSPLFAGIAPEDTDRLLTDRAKIKAYAAGELIAKQSDHYRSMLCIDEGVVRAEMIHYSGERIVIEEIAAPRLIAPAFLYASDQRLPVDIIAKSEVHMVSISREAFTRILQEDQRVLQNFLRIMSDRSHFLSERLGMMRFGTIQSKLANYLWEAMNEKQTDEFQLEHTQQELADLFGVTRPALARALGVLAQKQIISSKNRSIRILRRDELSRLL